MTKLDDKCSCIVPFYNEGKRVLKVIKALQKVPSIEKIICVDDGSDSSEMSDRIRKEFKNVLVNRLPENRGKAGAVKAGLDLVKTRFTILIDADLQGIRTSEIDDAIIAIRKDPSIGMIILKRINEPWYIKVARWDTLISGERILHTSDLQKIFSKDSFDRYQIEYAINKYMMQNKMKVRWLPSSAENIYKIYKYGIVNGLIQDIRIHIEYIRYAGVIFTLKSYISFCRVRA